MKRTNTVVFFLVVLAWLFGSAGTMVIAQNEPTERPAVKQPVAPPAPGLAWPPPASVPAPASKASDGKVPVPNPNDAPGLILGNGETRPTAPASPLIIPAPYAPQPPNPAAAEVAFTVSGPGQSNDNPTGRQVPAVSLEWIGPPTAKLGQAVTYQIIIKNITASPVQGVVVRTRVPAGLTVQATEPKAFNEVNVLIWDLGTLQGRQERRLDLQLLPDAEGDLACQALVTFTGSSTARIRVREPKLVLKASSPAKVLLGDAATITLMVTNPGDSTTDHVKVKAALPEGLEHGRGRLVEFDLGNLGPKETRSVQLVCATKSGGEQKCEVVATADGNLKSEDVAILEVILPRLELSVSGPKLRFLDRKAVYVFRIANPGSGPASNVTINDQIPDGFKFLAASDGGRHDFATRTVTWFVGDLTPGQSREVNLEVVAINTGEHKHKANVIAARGLRNDAEISTRVEGLPALLMELVDLDDPVEVGADTAYEIRITNTGTKTETNLQLVCTIPDKMEFRGASGAANAKFHVQGKDVTFEPLPNLAPRADAIYRVNVRGSAPGDLRFRARITADGLTEPVLKEESTRVYGDDAIK